MLQILFLYSLLPTMVNYLVKDVWGLSFNVFLVDPIIYAYVVFTLNTTAILSEVFRSSLLTVGHGQMEAALPNICNTSISLLKSTSLAFMMSVQDVTAIAKVKAAYGYNYIEAYLDICFIYIILCSAVQLIFQLIERHVSSYKKVSAA